MSYPIFDDVRFAFRQLRKSPGFTLTVLATLGLCIGANTAVYSVLDAVLLRPAPYPQPERLAMAVAAWHANGAEGTDTGQSAAMFEAVRDFAPALDTAVYGGVSGANFAAGGHIEYVQQHRVSTGFFRVLGVSPQFGREFSPAEDVPKGPPATILSYAFWQRAFHGDPSVLGSAINLRGEPHTVVGIMPRGFRSAAPVDLWTPLQPSRNCEGGDANYEVVARLRPGATWAQAAAQLKAIDPKLLEGADVPRGSTVEERIVPFQSGLTEGVRNPLLLTWGAVLVVLVIGCVNIAGLLLARSGSRAREIATRLALGGSRGAIIRQLLVESLVLGLAGCVAGIGVGALSIRIMTGPAGEHLPSWNPVQLDARVLAVMFAFAVVTSLLFGLVPAFQSSRVDLRSVLVEGGRGMAGGRRHWTRHALVAAEVALTLILLVGAGLLLRTLSYLNGLKPGFETRNVLTAQTSLADARYRTAASVNRLFQQGLDRVSRIPGVESAAVALTLPYQRPLNFPFRALDGDNPQGRTIETVYATPGYVETMRIPILRGRAFQNSDSAEAAKVVMVSQSFAAKFFHGDALGHHLEIDHASREIVGIVGDVQQHSGLMGGNGPYSMDPTVYLAASQTTDGFLTVIHTWFAPKWVVRTTGPVAGLAEQLQAAVSTIDPQLPMAGFQTIDGLQSAVTQNQRYNAQLFSVLAGLAMLLSAIGLYGLISQSITERSHELGVRMALGATPEQAMANAMKPGMLLAAAGVAAGTGLSLLAVRLVKHMIWGVQPADPITFAATAAMLLLVAIVASAIPALRILRLDPARSLRSE
ncbi:MAG TPA: ABC transporter permease [Bryobacteraceae bacterium]|nr:ABC transporter permease [Bryobacteraceae bacterium]